MTATFSSLPLSPNRGRAGLKGRVVRQPAARARHRPAAARPAPHVASRPDPAPFAVATPRAAREGAGLPSKSHVL